MVNCDAVDEVAANVIYAEFCGVEDAMTESNEAPGPVMASVAIGVEVLMPTLPFANTVRYGEMPLDDEAMVKSGSVLVLEVARMNNTEDPVEVPMPIKFPTPILKYEVPLLP